MLKITCFFLFVCKYDSQMNKCYDYPRRSDGSGCDRRGDGCPGRNCRASRRRTTETNFHDSTELTQLYA